MTASSQGSFHKASMMRHNRGNMLSEEQDTHKDPISRKGIAGRRRRQAGGDAARTRRRGRRGRLRDAADRLFAVGAGVQRN